MYKNLVIVSIDSLRADGTGFSANKIYGNLLKESPTPNLDKISANGTFIQKSYSTNTYTTAAHASLFTGKYPFDHGVRAFFDFKQKLNQNTETLAEVLNQKSFQTFFIQIFQSCFLKQTSGVDLKLKLKIILHGFMIQ